MNKNLELWQAVEKTDPAHTKRTKIGQMSITAVAPQHQRKRATEMFGTYGIGWGIIDESFDFLDFPDQTKLVTYHATMWYIWDGTRGEFPITSNSKVAFVTQGGKGYLKVDDEYAKKVQTDALTKGLSFLGFNADIFMGRYDDNKYVNQMAEEFAPKLPPAEPINDDQRKVIAGQFAKLQMDQPKLITAVKWASGNRTESAESLTKDEADKLIAGLSKKIEGSAE